MIHRVRAITKNKWSKPDEKIRFGGSLGLEETRVIGEEQAAPPNQKSVAERSLKGRLCPFPTLLELEQFFSRIGIKCKFIAFCRYKKKLPCVFFLVEIAQALRGW